MLQRAKVEAVVEPPFFSKHTPNEVFDYFVSEVLAKVEKELQDFLLKTAFLPRMTPHIAEEISGLKSAEHILSGLNHHNYFTEKRYSAQFTYQYSCPETFLKQLYLVIC